MLQRRRRLDLLHESLGAEHRGELGLEHFDRNLAIVLEILGEIDRGHAARAELALDAVAARERNAQATLVGTHHRAAAVVGHHALSVLLDKRLTCGAGGNFAL